MRRNTLAATLWVVGIALVGCDSPVLVDCARPSALARDQGRFIRLDDSVWCVYGSSARVECPSPLPEEHRLPWGGLGCAEARFEELPSGLCAALGECDGSAHVDGGS
ncbi:MAG: hypothetical protein AB8I08_30185 [Sandaracinaceae bacterium]